MPFGSCGCTATEGPVCETGHALFRRVALWYQVIEAPDFPACSVDMREVVLTQYQNAVNAYLSHCGCSVEVLYEENRV